MRLPFRYLSSLILVCSVYSNPVYAINDSLFRIKTGQLRRHIHLYQTYDCLNPKESDLKLDYLEKIASDLNSILTLEQSLQFAFSQFEMLQVEYIRQKSIKLISYNNNPCGMDQTNTLFIQWKKKDGSLAVKRVEEYGIQTLYDLNDSLFVFVSGVNDGPGFNQSYQVWKLANDSFSTVLHPWSSYYWNTHFVCQDIEINSSYIVTNCYGGYNPRTKTIAFEECSEDDDCNGFYYLFHKDHFVLRRKR